MEGAVVSASMGVISPLLAEVTILCARMPEGRAKEEMVFFERNLRSIQEMVSSLHAVKMSHVAEEDTLLKKRWAKQAREIAYDTQDFIDLFRHSAGLSLSDDTVPKTTGRLKKLRRFSRRPKKARLDREMANKIEELKARMAEVIERHKRFKIGVEPGSPQEEDMPSCSGHQIQSEASSSSTSRCPTVPIDAHLSALYGGGDGLVGLDGPRDELTALLMDDKQQTEMKVVSILGPEGIGKTTLAKEVYNNIQGRFACCAFVSMSEKTGIQEILQAFLSQFSAQDGASIEACQEGRLTNKLIQVLKGKRYFVVLDGVWSTRAWRLIRCALPGNNLGSRILMTTCIDDIAMSCCSTTADSIYRMKYLPEVEGKRLFMERTFGLEQRCPSRLEKICSEILKKCGGWPILILSIASLLASKSSSEEQWKMIQDSIGLALERPRKKKGLALEQSRAYSCDSLQGVKNIMYICYNDLPQHLKTCLLYLSTYPEGYVISRDHLVRRWIAEGFISVRSEHETLEETGQCYFNELINRGMIQPVGIQYDGRADACQVHNLMLSLIISISAEENFVTLFDGQAHELGTTDKVRRLSLNYHGQQYFVVPSIITASPVRSLTIFGSVQGAPILSSSRALRVFDLDVQGDPGKKYLGTIGSFSQLKYLRLQMSAVVELPEQIGELQFLETLDLTKTSIKKLPRSILRLWRLVYLLVCNVELPDGVGNMRSLEELSGIQVSTTNSTNSLLGVGQLTKLRIVQLIWSISDACSDIKGYEDNLVSSLKELSKLQSLCIESKDGSSLSFLDSWPPRSQPLQKLYLTGGYYFSRIPERIISLVNLDFLDISVYQVEDEMMNVFGSLPALLVLNLSSQVAATEHRIVVQPGLFHCLLKFTLTCLNSWTGLVIKPAALPRLARLGLVCYMQGQGDPVCGDYSIKYLSSLKNLLVEITFGGAGIWEVAKGFPKSPSRQIQVSDKQHMVKEEAEIVEAVESLYTHESFGKAAIMVRKKRTGPGSPGECSGEASGASGQGSSQQAERAPQQHGGGRGLAPQQGSRDGHYQGHGGSASHYPSRTIPELHQAPHVQYQAPVVSPSASGAGSSSQPVAEVSSGQVQQQFQKLAIVDQSSTSQASQLAPASSKSVRFPLRPGKGTHGDRCIVKANHFFVELPDKDLHQYDVSITPEVTSHRVNRAVMAELITLYRYSQLDGRLPAYDGRKSLYTAGPLPFPSKTFEITLQDEEESLGGGQFTPRGRERQFRVVIKFAARADLHHLAMFLAGKQPDAPQEALQVLDIVLRELPTARYSPVGRSFNSPDLGRRQKLGEGLESWRGFYQSIRPTQMGLSLNIDMSSTAFIEPLPVIDFVAQLLNRDISVRPLSDSDRVKIKKALRGVKVEVTHRGNMRRKYRISGLTSQATRELSFPVDDHGTVKTLVQYFLETYSFNIQHTTLPCLQVGNQQRPNYLPMEVCKIVEEQRYSKRLNEKQLTGLLKVTCQRPQEREKDILQTVHHNAYYEDPYAQEFGIKIDERLASVEARVLPPPRLKYHDSGREKDVLPRMGQWNMMNKKMVNGGRVSHWACINFSQNVQDSTARGFCHELAIMCQISGMDFASEPVLPPLTARPEHVEGALKARYQDAMNIIRPQGKELDLLIVILPDNKGSLYGDLKRICETDLGLVSQCCLTKYVFKMSKRYLANVALKINVKVGGRNTVLVDALKRRIPLVTDRPTIIFGADVTHPHPGEDSSPSIAAVVASQDWPEVTKYAGLVSAQAHRQELIQDLFKVWQDPQRGTVTGGMIKELLISFRRATGHKPQRIIFYRDGVSEGQFYQVLLYEVDAIRKACASLEPNYQPPVTFVVVQKRHHTRLFANNHHDQRTVDKSGNILPGTVVDSKICHPTQFDFYLCSHAGIQGTSRPAHYHVLWDENKFTADELQTLTNNLCYTYARCTRSVSIVPPAYYAHLAASRARFYMEPDTSDRKFGNVAVRPLPALKENVKRVMFYC